MNVEEYLKQQITDIRDQVSGLLSLALINIKDGSVLASGTFDSSLDLSVSSVFLLETYKQSVKSIEMEQGTSKKVYEVLITSGDVLYMLLTSGVGFLVVLAIDNRKSNLGLCRAVMNKKVGEILEGLRHYNLL